MFLGLLAWCVPCVVYGRVHHRLHKDSQLKGWSFFNGDVRSTSFPRIIPVTIISQRDSDLGKNNSAADIIAWPLAVSNGSCK